MVYNTIMEISMKEFTVIAYEKEDGESPVEDFINVIDSTAAYNLQALVRVLFHYNNDYSTEFLERCSRLLAFVLGISEDKARDKEVLNMQI